MGPATVSPVPLAATPRVAVPKGRSASTRRPAHAKTRPVYRIAARAVTQRAAATAVRIVAEPNDASTVFATKTRTPVGATTTAIVRQA